jgi:hypothetical protein
MPLTSADLHTTRTLGDAHFAATLRRVADRFQQQIEFVYSGDGVKGEPQRLVLFQSYEGDTREPWPASPPLQACQTDPTIGILGTGMAGTTHWSLALTPGEQTLTWDIACRFKKAATRLGSMYSFETELTPCSAEDGWEFPLPAGYQGRLTASSEPATPTHAALVDGRISFRPTSISAPPATIRWLFRLALIGPTTADKAE